MSTQQFRTLVALHLFTISVLYSLHDAKVMGIALLYASLAVAWRWWPFQGKSGMQGKDDTDAQDKPHDQYD